MNSFRIPLAKPDISETEMRNAGEAVKSTWISSRGPFVSRFEHEFADLCGVKHAAAVCNGTAALHLAMLALGLGHDDEVILPSLTFVAAANAVRYVGATPVFVDVDPSTWCLDPKQIPELVSEKTRGILAVHAYGHPADMDPIGELAAANDLWVIEDAAEAHFAVYKDRPVGGLSDIACFSFYGNKIVTAGEGGMVLTDDDRLQERITLLRGQGMDPDRQYYFPVVGYNYRMTNVASAIVCAQIERKDELIQLREEVFRRYRENLEGVRGLELQPVAPWAKPAPWLFSILVDEEHFGCSRDALASRLARAGIETRPFFIPIHTLPAYSSRPEAGRTLPVTEHLASSGLNLPTFSQMTPSEVDQVCEAILGAAR